MRDRGPLATWAARSSTRVWARRGRRLPPSRTADRARSAQPGSPQLTWPWVVPLLTSKGNLPDGFFSERGLDDGAVAGIAGIAGIAGTTGINGLTDVVSTVARRRLGAHRLALAVAGTRVGDVVTGDAGEPLRCVGVGRVELHRLVVGR